MGFTYNDVTSKEMGLMARLTSWQVCGRLRNFTTTVPGKFGVDDFGADMDYREITVSCCVRPKGRMANLVLALDEIAAWLDPINGLKQLIFDDVPDRYFMARLHDAVDCEKLVRSSGQFDLKFFCPDPFGYAVEDEIFEISEEGSHTITREYGNIFSNPTYEIRGVVTSGTDNYISITTGGSELRIVNATITEEEILVVDTEKMTAYVTDENGITLRNGLPYISELNFPTLEVGENHITVSTNNAVFTALTVKAKSRWR